MNLIDFLSWGVTIVGLGQAVLIFKKKKENMYLQFVFSCMFLMMSYELKLYADIFESAVLVALAILGTYVWNKGKGLVEIGHCTMKDYQVATTIFVVSSAILSAIMLNTDNPLPILDSVTTGLSLSGAYLMAIKKVEAWILWFVYDVVSCVVYLSVGDGLFNVVALNLIWTGLAIGTYITWKRDIVSKKKVAVS